MNIIDACKQFNPKKHEYMTNARLFYKYIPKDNGELECVGGNHRLHFDINLIEGWELVKKEQRIDAGCIIRINGYDYILVIIDDGHSLNSYLFGPDYKLAVI